MLLNFKPLRDTKFGLGLALVDLAVLLEMIDQLMAFNALPTAEVM